MYIFTILAKRIYRDVRRREHVDTELDVIIDPDTQKWAVVKDGTVGAYVSPIPVDIFDVTMVLREMRKALSEELQ